MNLLVQCNNMDNIETVPPEQAREILELPNRRIEQLEAGSSDDCSSTLEISQKIKHDLSSKSGSESPRDSSQIRRPKISSVMIQPHKNDAIKLAEKKKALLESQRNDKQVFNRNKRMFGMLMGTLQKFKAEETDREHSTIKRTKVEEKLESIRLDQNDFNRNSAKRFETSPKRTSKFAKDLSDSRDEIVNRFQIWDNAHRHLSNFIRTETKPRIFWLPKLPNEITEKKLKESRDYYNLYVAEKVAKHKKELADIDSEP